MVYNRGVVNLNEREIIMDYTGKYRVETLHSRGARVSAAEIVLEKNGESYLLKTPRGRTIGEMLVEGREGFEPTKNGFKLKFIEFINGAKTEGFEIWSRIDEGVKMEHIRISTSEGGTIGYYNRDEWENACEVLNGSDRVDIYDADGKWAETLTGAEFVRLYGEQ